MYQRPIIFICHFIWDKIALYQCFIFCLNSEQIKNVACYKQPTQCCWWYLFYFSLYKCIFFYLWLLSAFNDSAVYLFLPYSIMSSWLFEEKPCISYVL